MVKLSGRGAMNLRNFVRRFAQTGFKLQKRSGEFTAILQSLSLTLNAAFRSAVARTTILCALVALRESKVGFDAESAEIATILLLWIYVYTFAFLKG